MDMPDELDWDSTELSNTYSSNIDVDNLTLNTDCDFQSAYDRFNLTNNTDRLESSQSSYEQDFSSINLDFDELDLWLIDSDISLQLPSEQSFENAIKATDDPVQISDTGQYSDRTLLNVDELQPDTLHESIINVTENQNEQEKLIQSEKDKMALIAIDNSIHGHSRLMSIKTEPPDYWRLRYKSDGKRHIEKSRINPMEINLQNLKGFTLNANESLWIQLTLTTTKKNPKNIHLIHTNYLEYHDEDVYQKGHASVRIPVTLSDIQTGVKKFPCLSIIGMKRDDYKYELTPYGQLSTNNPPEKYTVTSAKKMTNAAKAKKFIKYCDLKSCHIACQLMVKQDDTWYMTDIDCKTKIINEKKSEKTQKNARKRLASTTDDECQSQDESLPVPMPKSVKRQKNGLDRRYANYQLCI